MFAYEVKGVVGLHSAASCCIWSSVRRVTFLLPNQADLIDSNKWTTEKLRNIVECLIHLFRFDTAGDDELRGSNVHEIQVI